MVESFLVARSQCRLCGAGIADVMVSFESVPVAGAYVTPDAPGVDPLFPLTLCRCRACGLAQLRESLAPSFYRQYRFVSGVATTYRSYLVTLADHVAAVVPRGCNVLEVGASDGTLLAFLRDRGLRVAGFEPSEVPAAAARAKGLEVAAEFFGPDSAAGGPMKRADLIIMRHVLEHVDDFEPIFAGLEVVAHDTTLLLVEVPDLAATAAAVIWSNIYHPHACYFDLVTLTALLRRHGWILGGCRLVPIFGGSLLAVAARRADLAQASRVLFGGPVHPLTRETLSAFLARWRTDAAATGRFFADLRATGLRVTGWGAGERTSALLGMAGLGREHVTCIYDQNPALTGLALAGSRIPVRHPVALDGDRPDVVAIFARSFESEIVAELGEYRRAGGRIVSLRTGPPSFLPS